MTVNPQRVASWLRQAAAIASIILGAIPATGLPNAVRAPLVALGGLLLNVEHYVGDPSTGNNVAPPSSSPPGPTPPPG